jgi:hypothetical protein
MTAVLYESVRGIIAADRGKGGASTAHPIYYPDSILFILIVSSCGERLGRSDSHLLVQAD